MDNTIKITFNPEEISLKKLNTKLNQAGYSLIIPNDNNNLDINNKNKTLRNKLIFSWIFALPAIIIGMFFNTIPNFKIIMLLLSLPVVFISGKDFFIRAYKKVLIKEANMDTLIALSTGISFLFSLSATFFSNFWENNGISSHVYYEATVSIIAFVLTGKFLEEKAKYKTNDSIRKLAELQSKFVLKIVNDKIKEVPLADVKMNDLIYIRPGDNIPVDGEVISGNTFVDESLLTGESVHVEKLPGNKVYAGTKNQKGNITIKALNVGEETYLSKIIELVRNAQSSKAPAQNLADKISAVFVPVLLLISIATFLVWFFSGTENALAHALMTSVTVLVIACPCALGLAIPAAIVTAIGKATEYNILVKNAESLQNLNKSGYIIFDKTGTLTEGSPVVTDIVWLDETDLEIHKSLLLEMEKKSGHPLSYAVVEYLKNEVNNIITLDDFEYVPARGLIAKYKTQIYYTGNKTLIEEKNLDINAKIQEVINKLEDKGKTVVLFANESKIIAIIAFIDKIKPETRKFIDVLKKSGIKILMLTGDSEKTAKNIAYQCGIDNYKANLSPIDKTEIIKDLQKDYLVCMVGDGINDSYALTQADIGIAIGTGSDIAIDSADIIITGKTLYSILYAIKISRKTEKTVKQNLFWAFIYNVISIPLAAGVLYPFFGILLNPMVAAAAMSLSSLSVVLNSLKLKFLKYENIKI
ncbi:MAG: heavy metal translocating P-type ATPase [Marinilabiliales bacterium]